ncbi:hypothetical protein NDU88_003738 [Pleurodeles waltl]|uniref:Retrotransposon gag domain-containing protein n=1 Tax=Pleurodeles waltl TaxID=8319 RepID=A0AAV7T6Z3_PLEWA|nr:hypothetical protein NDU88_003738 [Pleurodeles waltl]
MSSWHNYTASSVSESRGWESAVSKLSCFKQQRARVRTVDTLELRAFPVTRRLLGYGEAFGTRLFKLSCFRRNGNYACLTASRRASSRAFPRKQETLYMICTFSTLCTLGTLFQLLAICKSGDQAPPRQRALLRISDKYFAPKVCIEIIHYKFFQRKQEKGESVDDYVADLKKLALDCKFGPIQDDLIMDQVVMHNNNQSIQERLWINGDSSLEEIVAIVRKAENSERCVSELKSTERSFDNVCKINNRRTVKEQKTSQSSDGERRCVGVTARNI